MDNLDKLDFKEALQIAYRKSGLTYEEIAKKTNIHLSTIKRYFNIMDEYYPKPDHIIALSIALKTDLLIEWFVAHYENNKNFISHHQVIKEITDVIVEVTRALEDGGISSFERQKLIKEISEAKQYLEAYERALIKSSLNDNER